MEPISDEVFKQILTTLKHARVFIATREKMHPDGIVLYDDLVKHLEEIFEIKKE